MTDNNQNAAITELAALQQAFRDELPERMGAINNLWKDMNPQSDNTKLVDNLYRLVHNLAGAAGIFGVMPVTDAARELERAVQTLMDDQANNVADKISTVQALIGRLQKVVDSRETTQVLSRQTP